MSNLDQKPAALCVSKAMSPPLTCSGVREGLGEEGATLYFALLVAASRPQVETPSATQEKEKLKKFGES